MSKLAERPLALLLALSLSACAMDDFGEAVTDTRASLGDRDALTPEEEFPRVSADCGLPGAALTRHDTGWRLSLPAEIYAVRNRQPAAGRIACVATWARGRGLNLEVSGAR
ncbi:MAG TPA: hypothetical protein VE053_03975 [Allosphingosinicella sp.]|nr:hypothetical protein [Allosphingosinicella sp.]